MRASLPPTRTPGIEPIRMLPARPKSTLPPIQWAMPAAQSRTAAWKMSVPTTRCGVSRKTAIRMIAISVPEPAERQADHESGRDAGGDRGDDVAAVEVERVALLDHVGDEDRPQRRRDRRRAGVAPRMPKTMLVELVLAEVS